VEKLTSDEKRIRFLGSSSAGEVPVLWCTVEALPRANGVALAIDVPAEGRARVRRVRLLDEALWVTDHEEGGALIPAAAGEWHEPGGPDLRRRLEGAAGTAFAEAGRSPFTLFALGLLKAKNPLLVRWQDPAAALELARLKPEPGSFPGHGGLFLSLEAPVGAPPPEGAGAEPFAARVELITLGQSDFGASEIPRAARDFLRERSGGQTLRSRAGARVETRSLIGAAFFRPAAAERPLAEIARGAERLKERLEIDEAVFIPGGARAGGGESAGDAALKEAAARIRALGYLFGLEVEAGGFTTEKGEALKDICAPDLVLLELPRPAPAGVTAAAQGVFGLVGVAGGGELDLEHAAYLEGALLPFGRGTPPAEAWPLLPGAYGTFTRLSTGEALRPDDPAGFLACLLAGETPIYELPREGAGGNSDGEATDDPRWCFAREDGWAAGKGLSPLERFIKNTYEVASHVTRLRAREPFAFHRKLTPDGRVRETFFGLDLRVLVNFGPGDHEDPDDNVLLPPYGFFVRHPFLRAYHALRADGLTHDRPALFAVRSLEGKMYLLAEKTRIYHGFGPSALQLGGRKFDVPREATVKVWE
jgi:hypothetical protein